MFMDKKTDTINMSVFPNLIYRVNPIVIKITTGFFMALKKQIFTLIWKGKTDNTLEKKNRL